MLEEKANSWDLWDDAGGEATQAGLGQEQQVKNQIQAGFRDIGIAFLLVSQCSEAAAAHIARGK